MKKLAVAEIQIEAFPHGLRGHTQQHQQTFSTWAEADTFLATRPAGDVIYYTVVWVGDRLRHRYGATGRYRHQPEQKLRAIVLSHREEIALSSGDDGIAAKIILERCELS